MQKAPNSTNNPLSSMVWLFLLLKQTISAKIMKTKIKRVAKKEGRGRPASAPRKREDRGLNKDEQRRRTNVSEESIGDVVTKNASADEEENEYLKEQEERERRERADRARQAAEEEENVNDL
jgi:hypothetical protein